MIEKRILFIDDNPSSIKEQLELIELRYRRVDGIDIQHDIMDMSRPEFFGDNQKLDYDKILAVAKQKYFSIKYSVVACDLNLNSDGNVAGYNVLKKIIDSARSDKKPIRKADFIFYSAQTEKLRDAVLNQDELEKLIRLRITNVYKREKVCDEVGALLKKQLKDFSFDNHLVKTLSEYSDHTFQSAYPKFKGKTVGYVVDEIEKQTHHGVAYEKLLIELTVSNMIKLNNEE